MRANEFTNIEEGWKSAVATGALGAALALGNASGAQAEPGTNNANTKTAVTQQWNGKFLVPNILEKAVQYYITALKRDGKYLLVKSERHGTSGKSTTVRAIDCNNAKWTYIEDDGVKVQPQWSEFVEGSSAYNIALAACVIQDKALKEYKGI
jgi:hypothetical protein